MCVGVWVCVCVCVERVEAQLFELSVSLAGPGSPKRLQASVEAGGPQSGQQ